MSTTTRQTAGPVEHVSLNATNRPVEFFVGQVTSGGMDINPPYQRGDVWTEEQRVALIYSFLSGTPIPAVIINDRTYGPWYRRGEDKYTYAVIDGKQRILTVIAWMSGELAVPASWFPAEHIETTETTDDGPYVRYSGLTRVGQRFAERRASLPCAEGRLDTVEAEARVYLLVNGGGIAQTETDLANARRVAEGK